jgi:flagellar basal body rod protein FlgC
LALCSRAAVLYWAMIAAIATARSGLLASLDRLNAAAANIANGTTTGPLPESPVQSPLDSANRPARVYQPVDLAEEAVSLLETSLLFRANLAVLKAAHEMMGSVLDTSV